MNYGPVDIAETMIRTLLRSPENSSRVRIVVHPLIAEELQRRGIPADAFEISRSGTTGPEERDKEPDK